MWREALVQRKCRYGNRRYLRDNEEMERGVGERKRRYINVEQMKIRKEAFVIILRC